MGIIDDIKTNAFTAPSVDEIVRVAVTNPVVNGQGQLVTPVDIKVELENPNVAPSSFVSEVDVELIPRNGVIVFLAGTPLNFSFTDSDVPDGLKTRVSYTYQIPNVPGDDSTLASGRVTVWTQRIIAQTDMYDTSCRYPVNAALYVNERGMLTTRRISEEEYPGIAIVTGPPVSIHQALEFMLL